MSYFTIQESACLSPLIAVVNHSSCESNDKFNDRVRNCIAFVYSSVVFVLNSAADVHKVKKVSSNLGGMKS